MAEQKIRLGVIGAGWFASRRHLPEAQQVQEIELVSFCRRDLTMLQQVSKHFGVSSMYQDYRDMLDRESLDAALICSPHHLHFEHAKAALDRGLHVIMEKPMTLRLQDAMELIELAKAKSRVLLVALNPPYWRHDATACRLLAEGWIGDLEAISNVWTANAEHVFGLKPLPEHLPGVVPPTLFRANPESTGGGHFADAGAHMVSEVLWVTCLQAVSVVSVMDNAEQDMRSSVSLMLQNGVICGLESVGNSGLSDKRFRTLFYGSRGTLIIEGPPHVLRIEKPRESPMIIEERRMDPVPTPMQDFAVAVLEGRTPRSAGDHGAKVVAVTEAAYHSSKTGQRVSLH